MEDRKRPANPNVEDLAPPTKRQALNGGSKASADLDMPWKDDLEKYQKDAIYRQMLEYKRERTTLESQLRDIQKRATDHDDHLRIIDAWWSQLLDEVRLLSKSSAKVQPDDEAIFPTSLEFESCEEFTKHLKSKARQIRESVEEIFANLAAGHAPPPEEVQKLRGEVSKLLAIQKEQAVKFSRLQAERDQLVESLETASLRYMKAEKRLDRAKSTAVAKLEQQAIAGTGNSAGSGIGGVENGAREVVNGTHSEEPPNEASALALKEANATLAKQKEQLEAVMGENKSLTEQLTAANARLAALTDDDYAKTELFKQFRSQHEDVIKRINHLEATNIQLREEAEKYQAERTAYRAQIDAETEVTVGELESQLQRAEADLTRIRSARDELLADQAMRKADQEHESTALDQLKELVGAKDDRIESLESEVHRLRLQLDEKLCEPTSRPDVDGLGFEELRQKYEVLQQNFESVNKELPAMEKAYKRSMAMASKKVMDFTALEEKVNLLIAEKTKADQKYFAARKDMDTRIGEVRALRSQNAKSSEVISQLKDVSAAQRTLIDNLERQLGDLKQANSSIVSEHKKLEATVTEATSKSEALKSQVTEFSAMLKSKDSSNSILKQRNHALETELEQMRVRLEHVQKERDTWKAKSLSNQSGEEEMLRTLALCTICRNNFKNTVLKTCGHLFCNSCVEDRLANRMRKCPNCAKAFDKMDVMAAHM